ncbi:MAG: PAS domain S-box protein [Desulfobacterales bacterium]|nr:PAS domain S-box protein [Desulfobacterales bacterium]MCP4163869.1 PAS domain S-box protein [Deltaproteobacteria bacterium]
MKQMVLKIRNNFALKISATFCAFIIVASFFLVFLYIQDQSEERLNQMVKDGTIISQMLAHNSRIGIFTGSRNYLEVPVEGVSIQENVLDVYVAGVDWEIPFYKINKNKKPDIDSFKTDLLNIIKKFKRSSTPYININKYFIEFWAPVISTDAHSESFYFNALNTKRSRGKVVGVVKVTMDRTSMNQQLKSFAFKIVSIEILLVISGLLAIYLLVKRLTSPLGRLTKVAEVIGKGGSAKYIPVETGDEIGRLAKAFNSMTESLKQRDEALNDINAALEQKIKERTADLMVSTEKLEKEIDIRKKIEVVLKASEEKYRNILENIDEGYFETDQEGSFTFFNNSFCRILGVLKDDLTGLNGKGFLPEPMFKKMEETFEKALKENKSVLDIFEYNDIFMEMSLSSVKDGQILKGFRGFIRDVSERLKQEENRQILAKKLQEAQRMESIGTLAGGIAHDFNNLLMGIQGNTSLIMMKSPDVAPFNKHINNIENCVERASDLTNKLLRFARSGNSDLKPAKLNVTIKKTVDFFSETKKDIKLHESYTDDLWIVDADVAQMEQVFLNIFVNAYKAMSGKGDLFIESKNRTLDKDRAKPFGVKSGSFVQIIIRDDGCGMTDEIKGRIFEPFYTTQPMGQGSGKGLGLASVFGIVKKHGGFIDVISSEGNGTTFSIFLPASAKLNISETAKVSSVDTLLLVDEEEMVLEVGKPMLEEIGYRVITANGRKEANEIFKEKNSEIDMVILDSIPERESKTFNEFKELVPDIKILLSSPYKEDTAIQYDGFIKKPFSIIQLSQKISEIMLDDDEKH